MQDSIAWAPRRGARTLAALSGAALGLAASLGPAEATNGYFANGYGGGSKGMAGAGVTVGGGVLALGQNPALGVRVGNHAGLCTTHFIPKRKATIDGAGALVPGESKSDRDYFLIPCGGANFKLDEKSALALYVFGNGGMNTRYDENVFSSFPAPGVASSPLGVDLAQAFVTLNYSRRIADGLDIGVAPVFAVQRFEAYGLEKFEFFSSDSAAVTNNGHDWSYGGGVKAGVVWDASKYLTFGASYQSRMYMTKFDEYSGLFAEQGDFDIPPTARIGVAVRPAPEELPLTLLFEYERIWYGDVASVSNSGTSIAPGSLGADDGPGFGWDDMDIFRVAAIYKPTDALTLRTGVSYATQFADGDEALFNIVAPATPQWHASLGMSYKLDENWGVTGSYTHAFSNKVTGVSPLNPTQEIELDMYQHELAIGLTYRW